MLYLFHGGNDYLIKQAVNALGIDFSEVKTLDFVDSTREVTEHGSLNDLLSQQSLFVEKTLFVLQGFLKKAGKKELGNLLKYLQNANIDTNVVFCEKKLDQRLKIVKWLKENAEVKEFGELRKPEARKWILETIEQWSNGAIEHSAIEELIRLHGSNLWALNNEIKKLASFAKGRGISLDDVRKLCVSFVDEKIFDFTDAIAMRNKKKAAILFTKLLFQQQDPWYVFAMIVRQFRLLTLMKSSGKLFKAHPFVVQKTRQQAKYWELDELKKVYKKLLDIDLSCKTGRGDLKTELSLLIAQL